MIIQEAENKIIFYGKLNQLQEFASQLKQALKTHPEDHPLVDVQMQLDLADVINNRLNPTKTATKIYPWGENDEEVLIIEQNNLELSFQTIDYNLHPQLIQLLVQQFNLDYAWYHNWHEFDDLKTVINVHYIDRKQMLSQSQSVNSASDYDQFQNLIQQAQKNLSKSPQGKGRS